MNAPSITPASREAIPDTAGLPGHPRSRSECDALSAQLAAISHRLREHVKVGMSPDAYATARLCLDGLDAAQAVIGSLRLTLGSDTAHASITPKR